MVSRSIPFLSCSGLFLVLASAALDAGGWAVITVKDLPDYVVVGSPVTLTYAVRQHGRELLGGLDGRLEVRSGGRFVRTATTPTAETGHYSATFTLPYAGNWSIDTVSGWASGISGSKLTIQAIEADAPVPVVTKVERGHRLFTAKGCVTCHIHVAVEGPHFSIGAPELTSKRYQPEYLKRFLANPPQPQAGQQPGGMPDLKLRDAEIASLVAFINADQSPGGRVVTR